MKKMITLLIAAVLMISCIGVPCNAKENSDYIDFEIDENEDLRDCNEIESPDDFIIYHQDDYTVAYPADFYEYGHSDSEHSSFFCHAKGLRYSFEDNSYPSVREAYDAIYDEVDQYKTIEHEIVDKPEDGRLILSGRCEGYHGAKCSFYYLANVTEDHIYTMRIIFPLSIDKTRALHQAYIIDCLYRYCSFNGSTDQKKHEPREYKDFVDSEECDLELLMREE